MKKLISLIILCVMCVCCLFGCNGGDKPSTQSTPPASQEIAVSSISISKTSTTMTIGDRLAIYATVYPSNATNKNLTWSSTNSSVAEYINGEIYALGEGTCLIKATSNNGITSMCNVKVEKAPVYANSATFPDDIYYLNIGQEVSPKLQISPQELDSYKGKISLSNKNIVSATYSNDNNVQVKIVGLSEGETIITVTLDGGKQAQAKIVVVDCSKYVKLNLPETPKTVSDVTSSNRILTSSRIDNIDVSYAFSSESIIVATVVIKGTKTYDVDGNSSSDKGIWYDIVLYKENGVFCQRVSKFAIPLAVGETFTNSYVFSLTLDSNKTVREFTLDIVNNK